MTLFKRDHSDSPSRPSSAASTSATKKRARSKSPAVTNLNKPALPRYLRQSHEEISQKFRKIEQLQRERLEHGFVNGIESTWSTDRSDAAQSRNRYFNISPWNTNRVKLNVPETHNDYINASPIVLERTKDRSTKRYIATQGPKSMQAAHLWRMVYEQTRGTSVIVMLTKTTEGGREKCFQYFPVNMDSPPTNYDHAVEEFGDNIHISLDLMSLTYNEAARTDVRQVIMTITEYGPPASDGERREKKISKRVVWHLLFRGWPDWSVPSGEDKEALLALVQLANELNSNDITNPLIIHCSAGVGRSGTFITLDHFLTELNDDNLVADDDQDPVYDVINHLREQRMFMVQSEVQLHYIYKVLREKFLARYSQNTDTTTSLTPESSDSPKSSDSSRNSLLKP